MNSSVSADPVATGRKRTGQAGVLVRYLAGAFEGSTTKFWGWSAVRALAVLGFLLFAAFTSLGWLHVNITKPLKNEQVSLRDTYAISPAELDVALLRRWLPAAGKIGYLCEKPPLTCCETRMRLAPLLLDYDWQKYDVVLVDFPVAQGRALLESPSYGLVTALSEARAFARGKRIYRRNP